MINLNLFYLPIMDFEDIYNIHHYQDNEVNEVITSLLEDEELLSLLSSLKPGIQKYLPSFLSTKIIRSFLASIFKDSDSIASFQGALAPLVEEMIERTTSEFTISGLELEYIFFSGIIPNLFATS